MDPDGVGGGGGVFGWRVACMKVRRQNDDRLVAYRTYYPLVMAKRAGLLLAELH